MAAKRNLRVATDADATPKKPKTLAEAAEGQDYLEILIAQRREMIRDVSDVSGPAKAALHRQIALHSKEIATLQAAARDEQEATENGPVADEAFDSSAI